MFIPGTCVCDEVFPTNWYENAPYVDKNVTSLDSKQSGILPLVIREMVSFCCRGCNGYTTRLDFQRDSGGKVSCDIVKNPLIIIIIMIMIIIIIIVLIINVE